MAYEVIIDRGGTRAFIGSKQMHVEAMQTGEESDLVFVRFQTKKAQRGATLAIEIVEDGVKIRIGKNP